MDRPDCDALRHDLGLGDISVNRVFLLKPTDDALKTQFIHCGNDYPVGGSCSLKNKPFSIDSSDCLLSLFPVLRCSRIKCHLDNEFAVGHWRLAKGEESSSCIEQHAHEQHFTRTSARKCSHRQVRVPLLSWIVVSENAVLRELNRCAGQAVW
jgi:hypothetical protein